MKQFLTRFLLFAIALCVSTTTAHAKPPRSVVVWISIDGMRGNYVDSADTPFLHRLMKEGAFSKQLAPVFPSLTFPSHVSEVTGASVNKHGIIANAIYDSQHDRRWSFPNIASEILCEPLWTTVKRGGQRVLVHDWPVSQQQAGDYPADYFDQAFNTALTDQERLDRVLTTWEGDTEKQPLALLMGYVASVDKAGHKYGPESPETKAALHEVDKTLGEFFARCQEQFKKKMTDRDTLYFLLTTDHGMDDVHTIMNLEKMAGDAFTPDMRVIASGSVGNIFLERLGPPPVRQPHVEKLLKALEPYKFAHAYAREKMPAEWGYDHPTRTGDVVVSLDNGYMFTEKDGPIQRSVEENGGPLGMHGYPVASDPKMLGLMVVWRSGEKLGGTDLGPIDSRRMHSTVASWLGVEPAATAINEPLELPTVGARK
jgi:hypothetical protein